MTDPLLGRTLRGRYRVERSLGQGGMGAVYAATDIQLGRTVAVKTLLDVSDPRDLDRFRTEALAAAALRHPNVVEVFDFVPPSNDEPALLVMELLAGRSLSGFLATRGALSISTALHVVFQMLDAVGAAHHARIVHRDIKPANVIVLDGPDDARPRIKVVDFGIAKLMDDRSHHTTTGILLGTPAYMAPEQLLGERASERTDLYSIGVCLYEMIAGSRPFTARGGDLMADVLRGEPPALPVDDALASVIRRAMHRDPASRFASASEMAAALRNVRRGAPPSPTPKRKWPLFAIAFLVTIVASSGVALMLLTKKPSPAPTPSALPSSPPAPLASVPDPEPTSIEPEPSAAPSSSAVPRAPKTVLSYCEADGLGRCTAPVWECECWGEHNVIRKGAEPGYSQEWPNPGPWLKDKPCTGFSHFFDGKIEPGSGVMRCFAACDDRHRHDSWRQAVPGTPCIGYEHEAPIPGKWRPVPAKDLR